MSNNIWKPLVSSNPNLSSSFLYYLFRERNYPAYYKSLWKLPWTFWPWLYFGIWNTLPRLGSVVMHPSSLPLEGIIQSVCWRALSHLNIHRQLLLIQLLPRLVYQPKRCTIKLHGNHQDMMEIDHLIFLYHLIIKGWKMIQGKGQMILPNTLECQNHNNILTVEPSSIWARSHQDSRLGIQDDVWGFQGTLHLKPDS